MKNNGTIIKCLLISLFALILIGCDNEKNERSSYVFNNGNDIGEVVVADINLFREIVDSNKLAVIYVGRPACPACARLFPTIEEVAEEQGVDFFYIDLDLWNQTDIGFLFSILVGVRSTPTILVMQGEEVIDKIVGVHSNEAMVQFLENNEII